MINHQPMAKTVEQIYQKKTQKEHILLRPDTYIGATDKDTQTMYVLDDLPKKIVSKSISYTPGLYKIFDEILVNAADNKMRDDKMNTLKVTISPEKNLISIYNNGKGIPIEIHKKEQVYVPELIFGHLLTGSNYDDEERKITGGRNGYGAKLCNIFSTEFIVETADRKSRKKFYQRFSKNMEEKEEPVIESYNNEDFTRITFKPDLKRFHMTELDEDIVSLMKKRVYDMCGTLKNVNVYLNDEIIPIKDFREYFKLYVDHNQIVYSVVNKRWEIAFAVSEEQFSQVSFVNSICTSKGGTHVNHVIDQILDPLSQHIKKKNKNLDVKPLHIKSNIFIFINCLIENPAFDSQTKENLTLKASSFGSSCTPIDSFISEIINKTDLIKKIVDFSTAKQSLQLKKTDGAKTTRLSGIAKLDDANLAGTKESKNCTLILTEGDSAKTLAVSGMAVVGRDLFGVFPLRGKLLNVREASLKQIMENAEISNIKKILGLQHGKVYDDVSSLRYGHIMIMTDQDHDGSHIKGLIINFFDHFYPSLLKIPNFLQEFITPIIRATKGSRTIDFFTIPEYEEFKVKNPTGWSYKYYKGLGTSNSADAKKYFSNLSLHVKNFNTIDDNDRNLIDLAFNKKKTDNRKNWLGDFEPGTFLDQSVPNIPISDFINKEFILFSMADNIRSIPSVVDGLKPGQRKVLFSCFKRNLTKEIKVAQLVGYVAENSAYHHGEQSLCSTIINMAQDFVGSNNINLLMPSGQFGSRLGGGTDAASPRYIFTYLNPITRTIFSQLDDPILNYLQDENISIEPEYYVPILPMVLINGAEGIGTGWSTNIPNYNPMEIVENIRRLIDEMDPIPMIPYYRNFAGRIESLGGGKYIISGNIKEDEDSNLIEITELPIGLWTTAYKEYLDSLLGEEIISDFKEYHTEKKVNFLIRYNKKFNTKITKSLTTTNMVCFNPEGKIKKYNSEIEIIKDFYLVRLKHYVIRKEHRLGVLKEELKVLETKVRFINEVVNGILILNKRQTTDIIADLERSAYHKINDSFEYLLSMRISSLSLDTMEKLKKERDDKEDELLTLSRKTVQTLWKEDLNTFEQAYLKMFNEQKKIYDSEVYMKSKLPGSKLKAPRIKQTDNAEKKASKKEAKSSKGKKTDTVSKKNSKPTKKAGKIEEDKSGKKEAKSSRGKKTDTVSKKDSTPTKKAEKIEEVKIEKTSKKNTPVNKIAKIGKSDDYDSNIQKRSTKMLRKPTFEDSSSEDGPWKKYA